MKLLKASAHFAMLFAGAVLILVIRGLPVRGGSGATVNGDVNCDGKVDIADAIAIIQWQFSGGSAPCALAQDNFATRDELIALATRVAALEGSRKNDAKVATGTFTGDGKPDRTIQTGLAGKLRSLTVKANDSGINATVTDQTPDPSDLSFDGADFVIPNVQLNMLGANYSWIAFTGLE